MPEWPKSLRIEIHVSYSDEDGGWIAVVTWPPKYEGASAYGENPEDLLSELCIAVGLIAESLAEEKGEQAHGRPDHD